MPPTARGYRKVAEALALIRSEVAKADADVVDQFMIAADLNQIAERLDRIFGHEEDGLLKRQFPDPHPTVHRE